MRAAILVLLVASAGCLELGPPAPASPDAGEEWTLHGSFSKERTQEDLDAWCAVARAYGNECALMESFPEQFILRFANATDCRAARERLLAIPHTRPGECRIAGSPTSDPDGAVSSSDFAVSDVEVRWATGDDADGWHSMEWEVVRAWEEDGLVTVNTTTRGIEGGDFRFALVMRVDGAPATLSFEEGAGSAGTFGFRYTESAYWRGRPVDLVVAVSPASSVSVTEMDPARGSLAGTFHLDFTGRCTSDFNCPDRDALRRTVLDGSFST